MNKIPNQIILIGGGVSLREGINKGLWQRLEGTWTIGLNYSYKYFLSTCLCFVDKDFYFKEKLNSQPLIIGNSNGIKKEKQLPNTIVIRDTAKYDRNLTLGIYKASLVGLYALSLAIYLLDEGEIYLCYDDKTEVFTDKGWKYFKDLKGNELILTRKSNGETEWSSILAKQQYHYKGDMYHFKSKGIDLLVTPQHKFCLETDANYSNKFCNFSPSKDGYIWRNPKEFNTSNYFIPKIFKWKGNDNKKLPKDWLKLFAWYITEGCCISTKKEKGIFIYQTLNTNNYKEIINVVNQNKLHPILHKRGIKISNSNLYYYFKRFGLSQHKYIPLIIKNLPIKKLKILLNTMIKGDGHYDKKRNCMYYFTSSKQLADDVQEIAYKCGYYAEIYWRKGRICTLSSNPKIGLPQWTVYINSSRKQGNISRISTKGLIVKNKIKKKQYKGMVYDITVRKNHTLFVRRNNKCVWSGNCGYDYDSQGRDKKNNFLTHFYQGEIKHRGIGQVNYYHGEGRAERDFGVYKNEKKIKIYNVGLESKIDVFTKLSYDQFFKQLSL